MTTAPGSSRCAVLVVREGILPAGACDVVAEAGGVALLVGSGASEAAAGLGDTATSIRVIETEGFAPAAFAGAIAPLVSDHAVVICPAGPDGRDLAPRLARRLGRPLLTGALSVGVRDAVVVRHGGRSQSRVVVDGPMVVTLQPGVRGVQPASGDSIYPEGLDVDVERLVHLPDPVTVRVHPPDTATMDLAEAPRILGGGDGLIPEGSDGTAEFAMLGAVATALGASAGATRVITDKGLVGHDRQIGTTGVMVRPELYLAFGISGAVQHTAGLGHPAHVVSVNTDPHCPMMGLADLAVVADAASTLGELARLLGLSPPPA